MAALSRGVMSTRLSVPCRGGFLQAVPDGPRPGIPRVVSEGPRGLPSLLLRSRPFVTHAEDSDSRASRSQGRPGVSIPSVQSSDHRAPFASQGNRLETSRFRSSSLPDEAFGGRRLNYLDSAATALKTRRYTRGGAPLLHGIRSQCRPCAATGSPEAASEAYESARQTLARFVGADLPRSSSSATRRKAEPRGRRAGSSSDDVVSRARTSITPTSHPEFAPGALVSVEPQALR